ncbi:DUF4232 domain-containing protein [Streptomyces xanthochromogenes]|uniref:DUF4232 domain-containing protein n=1 Tax=Streptomyces xanthochromogenes TaxID=67384 RepID=UPI0034355287
MYRYLDPIRRSRRALLPLGAVALATLVSTTACGDSGTASTSPTPSRVTIPSGPATSVPDGGGAPTNTTRSAPPPAATAPAASPSSAGAARCTANGLRISLGRESPGAGNIYVPLVFTNASTAACSLVGFPGVSLVSASGARIGEAAQREGSTQPPVVLAPGKSAYASLHTVNEGVSDKPCWQAASWVQAYPPGSTQTLRVSAGSLRICGAVFDVSALRLGQQP